MKQYNLLTDHMLKFENFSDHEIEEMRQKSLKISDPMSLISPLRETLRKFEMECGFELEQRQQWREGKVEGELSAFAQEKYENNH